VDNACLVKKVGDSHLGFVYCLVENKPQLLTFEAFFHPPYCQTAKALDNVHENNPNMAEESSGDEAAAGAGSGSESKSDKASTKPNITVEVEEPMLKTKGKRKASELVGVVRGCKCSTKHEGHRRIKLLS